MILPPIVHIGDLHLGPNARNDQRRRALDGIVQRYMPRPVEHEDATVAAWLLPGDLNHGRMTIEDRNYLAAMIQAMAEVAPVVILYGNHDLPGDLDIFQRIDAGYPIYVVDRPVLLNLQINGLDGAPVEAVAYCLPYPTKGGLIAAGVSRQHVNAEAGKILELLMLEARDALREADARGQITLFLSHINVGGALTSTGQPNIGREIELAPSWFDGFPEATYIGANHIHRAQRIGRLYYPGSICRLDWGECEPKRYLEVHFRQTVNDMEHWSAWSHAVESMEIDVPPMYHVEGTLGPEGFSWFLKRAADSPIVENIPIPGTWAGAEVRVRYRIESEDRNTIDAAAVIGAEFPGAQLTLEPIVMRTRNIRAPEVVMAETLEDKLEALAGADWTPALAERLTLLQQSPDDTVFLAHVRDSFKDTPIPVEDTEPEEVAL